MESICFFCSQEAECQHFETCGIRVIRCGICGKYAISENCADEFDFDYESLRVVSKVASIGKINLINVVRENITSKADKICSVWVRRGDSKVYKDMDGQICPVKVLDDFLEMDIQHQTKPDKILQLLANKVEMGSPFQEVEVSLEDVYSLQIADGEELRVWVENLYELGGIEDPGFHNTWSQEHPWGLSLSPKGLFSVGQSGNASNRVFIAMQFDEKKWGEKELQRTEVKQAIIDGCDATGYSAECVDDEPHNKKICDKIVTLIRQSKFVIADLTGHNNGVYFEAGYAMGMGKDVVFTVHDSEKDDVHFDTRQYNRIHWSSLEDLREKLSLHLSASIK
jgi:nucleoside 2-deoxyribosyltransferase